MLTGSGLPLWIRLFATVAMAVPVTFRFTNLLLLRMRGSRQVF